MPTGIQSALSSPAFCASTRNHQAQPECRGGTEQLVRSKKLLLPMLLFADHVLPFVAASYILTGRFNPQRELENHPTIEATEAEHQIKLAKAVNNEARVDELEAHKNQQRARVIGTSDEWKQYRASFADILAESEAEQSMVQPAMSGSLKKFFRRLDESGTPVADQNGALWMEFTESNESSRIGLSANNVFSSGTDSELAFQLVLARIGDVLKSPKHSRESMVEFKRDWSLLESARSSRASALARAAAPATGRGDGVLSGNESVIRSMSERKIVSI